MTMFILQVLLEYMARPELPDVVSQPQTVRRCVSDSALSTL